MRAKWLGLATVAVLALAGLAACEEEEVAGPQPAGHTVLQDGVWHRTGLQDPVTNCTSCHGADLMGGPDGQPSCYTCHGKRWN